MSRALLHLAETEPMGAARPAEGPARLTIAISTLGSRLLQIDPRALPVAGAWRYLILVQGAAPDALPDALAARPDIDWLRLDSIGVAASRNRAIALAATEYLLFCDDDIELERERIAAFLAAFDARPDATILTGQTLRRDLSPSKTYAGRAHRLTLFNSAKTGTVEMMVRPARIREAGVTFNTAFGAGARYPLGDEYIFIIDCLRAGMRGWYVPAPIAVHGAPSSGTDWSSAGSAEARARVFDTVFGPLSLPVKLVFLARHAGEFRSLSQFASYGRAMLHRPAPAPEPPQRK